MVGVVFGFDVDAFADVDEEGDLDDESGFHGGGFVDVVCGVAFDAFGGFCDGHDHGRREVDRGQDGVGEEECVELAFDEVVFHGIDEVVVGDCVFVGLGIEEVVTAAVLVGVFVRDAFEENAFE